MKLFLTIAFLFCSILLHEQSMASLSSGTMPATGNLQKLSVSPTIFSSTQSANLIDQLPWCNEDDDELSANKKKVQALRSTGNERCSIQDYFNSIIGFGLFNNIHSLPGTDKCIFQRVLRV